MYRNAMDGRGDDGMRQVGWVLRSLPSIGSVNFGRSTNDSNLRMQGALRRQVRQSFFWPNLKKALMDHTQMT